MNLVVMPVCHLGVPMSGAFVRRIFPKYVGWTRAARDYHLGKRDYRDCRLDMGEL